MMFRKLQVWALSSAAALLFFVANTGISTKSVIIWYEPDIPESLK